MIDEVDRVSVARAGERLPEQGDLGCELVAMLFVEVRNFPGLMAVQSSEPGFEIP